MASIWLLFEEDSVLVTVPLPLPSSATLPCLPVLLGQGCRLLHHVMTASSLSGWIVASDNNHCALGVADLVGFVAGVLFLGLTDGGVSGHAW